MTRGVFLVGSAPFEPPEALELFGSTLVGLATRLPDGEAYGWLPLRIIEGTRGIVPGNNEPLQATGPSVVRPTLRLAEGVEPAEVEFEALPYARAARDSFAIFSDLRDRDKVAAGTRFQISIPSPFTACLTFDWDVLRAIWPVYERRLLANVAELLDSIPHQDLAISWDVVAEFMLLTAPSSRERYELEEMAAGVGRLIDAVPPDVETGLHFCYGRHNSKGEVEFASDEERALLAPTMRDISNTELMVRFFNAIHDSSHRQINWLHIPVPRQHDDTEFYAPLADLKLDGVAELYLGLLHIDDGLDGAQRKIAAAQTAGVPFGIAAPCGFRASTTQLPESVRGLNHDRSVAMVEFHRQVAEHGG